MTEKWKRERWAAHKSIARGLRRRAYQLRADAERIDAVAVRVLRLGDKYPRVSSYSTYGSNLRVADATYDTLVMGGSILVSPDANAVVDSFEIAVSDVGEVNAWVYVADVDGHVFSLPAAFVIGHSRKNLPHVAAGGWRQEMANAGLPPAIIQMVQEAFDAENARIATELAKKRERPRGLQREPQNGKREGTS